MGIKKEGKTYRADVLINGKVVSRKFGFRNKSLAKKWHDRIKNEILKDGSSTECYQKSRLLKFYDLMERYLELYVKSNLKETTQKRYLCDLKYRIEPEFGHFKVGQITSIDVQRFQSKLVASKLSTSSINHTMGILYSIFDKGILWDMCVSNPCKKLKRLKKVEKPYCWWKDYETILKFLQEAKNHKYFVFYLMAIETGLRLGELVGLTWDAIDLVSGRVEVFQQYSEKVKKITSLKNSQIRRVWIPEESIKYFRKMKFDGKSEFVFNRPDGSLLCSSAVAGKIFVRLQKLAGVPRINFHGLRHTYASHYVMNGGNIYELSKLLGHSSIDVTMRYAHLSEEGLNSNRNRVSFKLDNITEFNSVSRSNWPDIGRIDKIKLKKDANQAN